LGELMQRFPCLSDQLSAFGSPIHTLQSDVEIRPAAIGAGLFQPPPSQHPNDQDPANGQG
jgi:hypothetical protein